jgi:hypothetical protein
MWLLWTLKSQPHVAALTMPEIYETERRQRLGGGAVQQGCLAVPHHYPWRNRWWRVELGPSDSGTHARPDVLVDWVSMEMAHTTATASRKLA